MSHVAEANEGVDEFVTLEPVINQVQPVQTSTEPHITGTQMFKIKFTFKMYANLPDSEYLPLYKNMILLRLFFAADLAKIRFLWRCSIPHHLVNFKRCVLIEHVSK